MAETAPYMIESIESAPFGQMTYVIWKPAPGDGQALVVDPGFDVEAIFGLLEPHALQVAAILNTHGHADHIAGNAAMKQAYPAAPLIIGRNEARLLTDPDANLTPLSDAADQPPGRPARRRRRAARAGRLVVRGPRDPRPQPRLGRLRLRPVRPHVRLRRRRPLRRLGWPDRPGRQHAAAPLPASAPSSSTFPRARSSSPATGP